MKKYDFTYEVVRVDTHQNFITVRYLPLNEALTAYVLQLSGYTVNEDTVEIVDLEQEIIDKAPHVAWEAQEHLTANFNNLLNKTGTVIVNDA